MASTRWTAVLLAVLVVLAGCSGLQPGDGGDAEAPGDAFAGGGGDGAGDTDPQYDGRDDRPGLQSLQTQRAVVRTGTVVLEVESFEAARDEIAAETRARGGFVSDSSRTVHTSDGHNWTTGRLVVRVPGENATDLQAAVERTGSVQRSEIEREDVTERLVDLEARLENLRAQRDRLRRLYEEANTTEDVLAVGERLSDVQGEIERLEAKRRALADRVAYSTLTIELSEPRPDPATTRERWYDVGVVGAFLASVDGVVVTVRAMAVGVAYALPYAVVFGGPLALAGFLLRRRRW